MAKSIADGNNKYFISPVVLKLTKTQKEKLIAAAKADYRSVQNYISNILEMEIMRPNGKILQSIKPVDTKGVTSILTCSRRIKGTRNMQKRHKDYAFSSYIFEVNNPTLASALHTIALAKRRSRPQLITEIILRAIEKVDASSIKIDKKIAIARTLAIVPFTEEQLKVLPQNMIVSRSQYFAQKIKQNLKKVSAETIAKYKIARKSFKQSLGQSISQSIYDMAKKVAVTNNVAISDVIRTCVLL